MTRHYPDLGSASDWSYRLGNLIQPIRSTTQLWVVTRHQYGISALFSQTSFGGKNSGSVAKCRLFSQAKLQVNLTSTLPFVLCTNCTCNGRFARFFSISSLRLKKSLVYMSEANTSNFHSGQNICSLLFEGSWLLIFALWSQKQALMWQFLFHLL